MFIYVLVQCEAVNIEVEADYMWGLLEPSKLSGEGGYYLTTLSSASKYGYVILYPSFPHEHYPPLCSTLLLPIFLYP